MRHYIMEVFPWIKHNVLPKRRSKERKHAVELIWFGVLFIWRVFVFL